MYDGLLDKEDDSRRGSTAISNEESPMINAGSKTYQVAKRWYALADEDEKLCISGITTHKWIEDGSIASTHQLLIPCDSNLEAIRQRDVIIENRERKLKVTTATNQFDSIITLRNTKNIFRHNYAQLSLQNLI